MNRRQINSLVYDRAEFDGDENKVVKVIPTLDPLSATVPPGWMVLEMLRVGKCKTDEQLTHSTHGAGSADLLDPEGKPFLHPDPTEEDKSRYIQPGHEAMGRIVKVSEGVDSGLVGRYATPMVRMLGMCSCQACRDNQPDYCMMGLKNLQELGIFRRKGGFAQRLLVKRDSCIILPETMKEPRNGAALEPITVMEKCISAAIDACPGPWKHDFLQADSEGRRPCALVEGTAIGLLGVGALLRRNIDVVMLAWSKTDPTSSKQQICKMLGVPYISRQEIGCVSELLKHAPQGHFDLIADFSGSSKLIWETWTHLLKSGTMFAGTSILDEGDMLDGPIDFGTFYHNWIMLQAGLVPVVNASQWNYDDAVRTVLWMEENFPNFFDEAYGKRYGTLEEVRDNFRNPADAKVIRACYEPEA